MGWTESILGVGVGGRQRPIPKVLPETTLKILVSLSYCDFQSLRAHPTAQLEIFHREKIRTSNLRRISRKP